jgi:small nuclear ribonucleoprotein (snRNP)-like protein
MRRNRLVNKAIRRRFAVTLCGNEGVFSGVLTESDDITWVFDDCATVPSTPDAESQPIAGRVYIDRVNVAYLQELPT